jgi:hypothetical protein
MQDSRAILMSGEPQGTDKHTLWELWRQDDNGVRVLIACFEDHGPALEVLARFESRHHKQTYWIEDKGASGAQARPPEA